MKYDPLRDGISCVELIDHMGDDLRVVNAARVSLAKESDWEYVATGAYGDLREKLSERDEKLVRYLARHKHWTPFAHCVVTLRLRMPIFVARQWFRHTVGFVRNEVSRRYVDEEPQFFLPQYWRERAKNVKQGSGGIIPPERQMTADIVTKRAYEEAKKAYDEMLKTGVAPEMARMVLPQATYTEFYETGSLAAYARLCSQRLDSHAQAEVRAFADAVSEIMRWLFPISWDALMEESDAQEGQ